MMQFEIYTLMLALLKVTGNSELGKYVRLNHQVTVNWLQPQLNTP